ncbi:MAG: hypothetical protein PHH00_01305 [Candidatus Nanoarchaeia archaeon]|nr:hypothetical protein [Candidatus Nanoarchaeia archaeon]
MKRGKNVLLIASIIAILIFSTIGIIYASVNKSNAWHPASSFALKIDGTDRTLAYAITNSLLKGTHTYAAPSSSSIPNPGHNAGLIWVSVNGVEKTLLNSLSTPNGLCGNSVTASYKSAPASGAYHLASGIEVTSLKSLQNAIDSGDFCCASYGTPCGSCGGITLCDGTCSVATPSNFGQSCTTSCGTVGKIKCDGSCFGYVVSYSPNSTFSSNRVDFVSVAGLDSTHFVVIYDDLANSAYGTAKVGVFSGGGITFGSPVVFSSVGYTSTTRALVLKLDTTHVLVLISGPSGSKARVGTVSGSTISFGSEYSPGGMDLSIGNTVTVLDSTHFIVSSRSSDFYGKAVLGTISGSTISFSSAFTSTSSKLSQVPQVYKLDSNKFILTYTSSSSGNPVYIKIGTISGSSITFGSEYDISYAKSASPNPVPPKTVALDSTHFVMASQNASVETVSGSSITHGGSYQYPSYTLYMLHLLDSNKFFISQVRTISGTVYYEHGYIGTISGTSISYDIAPSSGIGTHPVLGSSSLSMLNSATFVRVFPDYSSATGVRSGKAAVGKINECH